MAEVFHVSTLKSTTPKTSQGPPGRYTSNNLFADLSELVPAGLLQGRCNILGADVALAQGSLVHGARHRSVVVGHGRLSRPGRPSLDGVLLAGVVPSAWR